MWQKKAGKKELFLSQSERVKIKFLLDQLFPPCQNIRMGHYKDRATLYRSFASHTWLARGYPPSIPRQSKCSLFLIWNRRWGESSSQTTGGGSWNSICFTSKENIWIPTREMCTFSCHFSPPPRTSGTHFCCIQRLISLKYRCSSLMLSNIFP